MTCFKGMSPVSVRVKETFTSEAKTPFAGYHGGIMSTILGLIGDLEEAILDSCPRCGISIPKGNYCCGHCGMIDYSRLKKERLSWRAR